MKEDNPLLNGAQLGNRIPFRKISLVHNLPGRRQLNTYSVYRL
jgi:hypothetical protein